MGFSKRSFFTKRKELTEAVYFCGDNASDIVNLLQDTVEFKREESKLEIKCVFSKNTSYIKAETYKSNEIIDSIIIQQNQWLVVDNKNDEWLVMNNDAFCKEYVDVSIVDDVLGEMSF